MSESIKNTMWAGKKTFTNKKEVPMSPEKIPTRTRLALAQKLRWSLPPSWSLLRILRPRH